MVRRYGIDRGEAVSRINRHWSWPVSEGPVPYVWIVGLDIAYHEDADFWATDIYFGPDHRWRNPGTDPQPLPPP